jgi:hypothetical protein
VLTTLKSVLLLQFDQLLYETHFSRLAECLTTASPSHDSTYSLQDETSFTMSYNMPVSANEIKEKIDGVVNWLAEMQSLQPDKAVVITPKKTFPGKISQDNPHAVRDLFGPVPANKRVHRAGDNRRRNAVVRRMKVDDEERYKEIVLRRQVDAGWEMEVRGRKKYAEQAVRRDQKPGPVCCQCGAQIIVWGEWVAPVCLNCYHTICNERCMAV